ncbi:MAG: helix-turn-helix domain-containing protein, partial [Myxococcota bacterium]
MRMADHARRQDLLQKGRRLFAASHADSRSMAALAKEAGCSKALLYHHFGNRRGYYLAVLEDIAREFTAAIEPDPTLPFEAALQGALGRFLRLAQA